MKKQLREIRGLHTFFKGLVISLSFLLSHIAWSQCNVTQTGGNPATAGTFANCLTKGTDIVFQVGGNITYAGGATNHWVTAANGITIDGNGNNPVLDGSLLNDAANTWKSHTLTIAHNNITIQGVSFTKAPDNSGFGGAGVIMGDGVTDVTFTDCKFNDNTGAGLQNSDWVAAGTPAGVKNLTLTNCSATGNKLSGVQLVRTDNVNISGGEFFANAQSGIYFERSVTNGTIDNVKVYGNGLPATGNTDPTNQGNIGAGIRVYDGGTALEQSTKITVSNSEIYNNNIHGVELPFNSDEVNVFKNEIYGNGTGTSTGAQACGIVFQFGGNDNCTVAENNIHDNRDAGIYMYRLDPNPDHSGNVFYKNTVTDNGGGIIVISSKGSFIAENTISGTTAAGGVPGGLNAIYFGDGSDDGVVYKNTVTGTAGGAGIHISDEGAGTTKSGSNGVYILGNSLDDNSTAGIKILNSDDAHIGAIGTAPTITRNITGYGTINIGPYGTFAEPLVSKNTITKTIHCIDAENSNGIDINGSFIGTADGINVGTNTGDGIHLNTCTDIKIGDIKKNVISGNPSGYGIYATNSSTIKIYKNYIGINDAGTTALPNGKSGIFLDATNDSEVGDGTVANRNVISGNTGDGIEVSNNATNVKILNNYVGLDQTGINDVGNVGNGINMTGANQNEIIDNIISGNTGHGLAVQNAATSNNKIQKNTIGLNANNLVIANDGDGIYLDDCKNNFIGGVAGEGNVVSGNGGYGISLNGADSDLNKIGDNKIGIDPITNGYNKGNTKSGIYVSSNATNNVIGDNGTTSEGNIISGNGEHGIEIDGSINNNIDGNIIGMNDALTQAHKNGVTCTSGDCAGIYITNGASNNQIGVIKKNTIAGDHQYQILIDGGSNGNKVQNNDIGLDNTVITNGESIQTAIRITGAGTDNNEIGLTQTEGNLIVHSSNQAILIDAGASGNKVSGNTFIGSAGSSPESAITIDGASNNIIGGIADNTGNIIEKTAADAIIVKGTSDANQIQTNFIGTDATGSTQKGPIQGHGIQLTGAGVTNTLVFNNTIGMVEVGQDAIHIDGIGGTSEIYGNYIGITKSNVDIPNNNLGILVINATGVSIGKKGENPNVVANGAKAGIRVEASTTTTVINNYVGTNTTGTAIKANAFSGINIAAGNTGVTISENVVSGNGLHGIQIQNDVAGTNTISDNKIGFDATAGSTLKNGEHAILFDGAVTNFTVSGNEIGGHTDDAIEVLNSQNITFSGNFIGTNATGTTAFSNTKNGIHLGTGSGNITINNGNVISGNGENGISIDVSLTGTNSITGNTIGLNLAKDAKLGNGLDGVSVVGNTGTLNIADNSIGGNTEHGVEINASQNITLSANRIGVEGTTNLGNTLNGVEINTTSSNIQVVNANQIGFNQQGINIDASSNITITENSIASNALNGINAVNTSTTLQIGSNQIGLNQEGVYLEAGSGDVTINANNVISGNIKNGINVDGTLTGTNTIDGNIIGLDLTGASAAANVENGIKVSNNTGNLTINQNNIGGNTQNGIELNASTGTIITANQIGVVAGNGIHGIALKTASNDTKITTNNVIGQNAQDGINANASTGTEITGNQIGVGTGNANIGNTGNGISLEAGSNDTKITGSNIIGFNVDGINANASTGTIIQGNSIGSDGTNNIGNTGNGINIANGSDNADISASNVIGNNVNGIDINASSSATITGNTIGGDTQGNTIGINIANGGVSSSIGTNTISHNSTDGIVVDASSSNQNTITQNSMFCNGTSTNYGDGTGITLSNSGNDGFAPNMSTLVPALLLKDAANNAGNSSLIVDLTGITATKVEVFENDPDCQNCQGKTYVGDATIATDATTGELVAIYKFSDIKDEATDCGRYVITATDATGNTSEFSKCSVCSCKAPTTADYTTATLNLKNASGVIETCHPNSITIEAEKDVSDPTVDFYYAWFKGDPTDVANATQLTTTPSNTVFTFEADSLTANEGSGKYFFVVAFDPNNLTSCSKVSPVIDLKFNPNYTPKTTAIEYCKDETPAGDLSSQVAPEGTEGANPITYTWYDAATAGSVITPVPTATTTTAGKTSYWVTETVLTCEGPRVELEVTVKDLFSPTTATLEKCKNATVTSAELEAKVTKANAGTIKWYADATTTTSSTSPSGLSTGTAGTTSYFVTETVATCEGPRVQIDFVVNDLPTVTFDPLADMCDADAAITFPTDATVSGIPTGGTGVFSMGGSPITSFDPSGKAGLPNTITYTYTDLNTCVNTATSSVTVQTAAKPTISGTTQICEGKTTTLIVSNASTYTWSPSTGLNVTTGPNVDATLTNDQTYTVSSVDVNGCKNTATVTITVNKNPTVTIADDQICEGDNGTLTATPSPAGATYSYSWNGGANTLTDNPTVTTPYKLTITNTTTGCISPEVTGTITVIPVPVAQMTLPAKVCSYDDYSGIVVNTNSSVTSYNEVWTFNNQSISSAPSFTGSDDKVSGTYTVKLVSGTCESNVETNSIVVIDPSASIAITSGKSEIKEGESVTLTANAGSTDYSYSWTSSEISAELSTENPVVFSPVQDITYYVTATQDGCEAVAEKFIRVRSKIVIPNGFSPNGDDKNENWIIKNIEDYEGAIVRVFNRWGNLVYQSEPGYKIPWNGLTEKGNPMPVATYYYIVELNVDDEEYAGSVTIVR